MYYNTMYVLTVFIKHLLTFSDFFCVDESPLDSGIATTFIQQRRSGHLHQQDQRVFQQQHHHQEVEQPQDFEDEDHITSYYGGEIYNGLYVPPLADPQEELRRQHHQQSRAATATNNVRDNYAYLPPNTSPLRGVTTPGFPSVTPSPAMATVVYPEHAGHLV